MGPRKVRPPTSNWYHIRTLPSPSSVLVHSDKEGTMQLRAGPAVRLLTECESWEVGEKPSGLSPGWSVAEAGEDTDDVQETGSSAESSGHHKQEGRDRAAQHQRAYVHPRTELERGPERAEMSSYLEVLGPDTGLINMLHIALRGLTGWKHNLSCMKLSSSYGVSALCIHLVPNCIFWWP